MGAQNRSWQVGQCNPSAGCPIMDAGCAVDADGCEQMNRAEAAAKTCDMQLTCTSCLLQQPKTVSPSTTSACGRRAPARVPTERNSGQRQTTLHGTRANAEQGIRYNSPSGAP